MKPYKNALIDLGMSFLAASVIIALIYFFCGCAPTPVKVDVHFWAGDSAKAGISRSQEQRTIGCSQPAFDDYACLSYEDVQELFNAMIECNQGYVE